VIELHDVALAVPGRMLVRDVNARVDAGEFVAVLGPNGVGKTTLLRALCGMTPLHAGSIALDGRALAELSPRERARTIAFVTADDAMIDALTVADIVAIGRFAHHAWWQWQPTPDDRAAIDRALDAVHLRSDARRIFATLSSGERQRAWIAMGLAQETPILLLDEPTSHLDVRVAHEILALLQRLARDGRTILCVLHDLNDAAAYADRLMLLGCETMLACAPPAQVLTPALIERAYGVSVERVETPSGPRVFASPVQRRR
jgi:ABC-type cobalamin/Fe3+-siderophores transport system ATPase subunit